MRVGARRGASSSAHVWIVQKTTSPNTSADRLHGRIFLSIGGFFAWAMIAGQRDPNAPKLALLAAFAFVIFLIAVGAWMLAKAAQWDSSERR